ncbi:unnamed protein product [Meloidogyne enterolobii]|uniref:Uncharacterized protein n=1 Tax=Meloidogyne enterolobii TaxID=390850 RepID=A0ACB1B663_MELEN
MPLATRPHFNNNHKQNHKSSPSIKRYDKSHDEISTKFKATTPPSAPISTDEIGFKSGPSTNYYERKNRPIIKDKGPCACVELMISARTLADRDFFSKSDPICIVEEMTTRYTREDSKNEFVEIGRTECIKNSLNPVWNKRITLDYYFESKQLLRFKIYDIDSESAKLSEHDFLGKCECELADIVAAPNGICEMKVFSCKDVPRQGGLLLVCAEELDEGQRDIVHFSVRGVALNSGGSFLRKCVLNPNTFLEFYRLFCDGSHHLIGSTQTSLNALTSHQQNQLELIKTKKNKGVPLKVPKGILHFMDVQIRKEFTFLDFIASGLVKFLHKILVKTFSLQLEFAVAVDLTASNGEISKSSSLHYVNSQYLNQYECAICAVLEICEHYNHSKMFETIGFGAKIPPAFTVSHMFPLRLNNFERSVEGIQGVLDAYRYAIVNTQLYGPTNFAPTIREFVHKCQQFPRDGTKYQVCPNFLALHNVY